MSSSGRIDAKLESFFSRVKHQMKVFRTRTVPADEEPITGLVAPTWRFSSPTDVERRLEMLIDESKLAIEQSRTISAKAQASIVLLQVERNYHLAGFDSRYLAYEATTADDVSRRKTRRCKRLGRVEAEVSPRKEHCRCQRALKCNMRKTTSQITITSGTISEHFWTVHNGLKKRD
jgi:hypothetical protein